MPHLKRLQSQQLVVIADHIAARRETILQLWRKADRKDPEQTTGRALTLAQFRDHIPEMLDAFESRLRAQSGGAAARAADAESKEAGGQHTLHRWQQGYRLQELINECGHLQLCLSNELDRVAAKDPAITTETLIEARRQIMALINDTINDSACQYDRIQKTEAAGHVGALHTALESLRQIEKNRSALFHQIVHDLRNDVHGVSLASTQLGKTGASDFERLGSATFLTRAVEGLNTMLGDLLELARLEAGQETRKLAAFDAAALLAELCDAHHPLARESKLSLKVNGPQSLMVVGDAEKTRRLAKNLLGNALKYTAVGGVDLTWGEEGETWWLMVKDTGPGLSSGRGGEFVVDLQKATASAKESDEDASASSGQTSQVLSAAIEGTSAATAAFHRPGEGIGLSIVKRLCELLDASIELASSAEAGTTIRVVFPRTIG